MADCEIVDGPPCEEHYLVPSEEMPNQWYQVVLQKQACNTEKQAQNTDKHCNRKTKQKCV